MLQPNKCKTECNDCGPFDGHYSFYVGTNFVTNRVDQGSKCYWYISGQAALRQYVSSPSSQRKTIPIFSANTNNQFILLVFNYVYLCIASTYFFHQLYSKWHMSKNVSWCFVQCVLVIENMNWCYFVLNTLV